MARSCLSCRYLQEMPFGDRQSLFCTRAPPKVEVLRTDKNFTLLGWYPPMPLFPCGEYQRAWWRRALKLPAPPAAPAA